MESPKSFHHGLTQGGIARVSVSLTGKSGMRTRGLER